MNITETLLRNLSAGELQQLACEILSKENREWSVMSQMGGCEGGFRTRKGTPDMWCVDKNNNYICIQATADSAKGKLYKDICKVVDSLLSLGKNEGAVCISFLNFDPSLEEIQECKNYCEKYKCKYEFYNNRNVAKIIDTKYPEIKIKFLKLNKNEDIIEIQLLYDSFQEQIEYITNKIEWIDKDNKYIAVSLMELAKNSFEHGNASKVSLIVKKNSIKIKDNGTEFNVLTYKGNYKMHGGGKYTLEFFLDKYKDNVNYNYQYINSENIISFDFNKKIRYDLIVDDNCSIDIPKDNYLDAKKAEYVFNIPQHCSIVRLKVNHKFMMISDFGYIINKIIRSIPHNYKIEIALPKEESEFIRGYLKYVYKLEDGRIALKEIN